MRRFQVHAVGMVFALGVLAAGTAQAKGGSLSVGQGVAAPRMGGQGGFMGDPAFRSVAPGLSPGLSVASHPRLRGGHGTRRGHDRAGRGHWRRGWSGVGGWVHGGWWGYGGWVPPYASTIPEADQFGYFTTGGDVTFDDGEATYHYDRGYPYEWYRGSPPLVRTGKSAQGYKASLRCETQWVPEASGRGRAAVRICRR